jgi:hypothetical protein
MSLEKRCPGEQPNAGPESMEQVYAQMDASLIPKSN